MIFSVLSTVKESRNVFVIYLVERIFMSTQTLTLPALCKEIIDNPERYVVIDSETTGLQGEILDLAIVAVDGTVLFNELLKPTCPIEEGAMAVHGITEDMVATARTFAEAWADIDAALGDRIVIAYNVDFDRARFRHTAQVHGITLPHMEWRCMMRKYAQFWDAPNEHGYADPGWQKLEKALIQQGVPFSQEHRALGDALAVARLIQRLAELGDAARRWSSETVEA
jgi:DNA polymerase III epsilon subunit-like protein